MILQTELCLPAFDLCKARIGPPTNLAEAEQVFAARSLPEAGDHGRRAAPQQRHHNVVTASEDDNKEVALRWAFVPLPP